MPVDIVLLVSINFNKLASMHTEQSMSWLPDKFTLITSF